MLEVVSMRDLPARITPAHVAAETKKYPRSMVMLEDHGGWAVYAAASGRRVTEHRRNWIAALLDLAALLPMVTTPIRPKTARTHEQAPLAHVEGRV